MASMGSSPCLNTVTVRPKSNWVNSVIERVLMIDCLSNVETDKLFYTVKTDIVKLVVEIESFGMSSDESDKETESFDGLQPKQADLCCVHALNELHLHEIRVVPNFVMSDSEDSTVTYTEVSSPFEDLSDIGSPGVDGIPMMLEDPYEDDEDPEEDPADYPTDRDDDDDEEEEEPSEDNADDEEDKDEDEDEDEDEEEEYLVPAYSVPPPACRTTARMSIQDQTPVPFSSMTEVDRFLAISTPPPSPLTSYSSPLPQIPSPPLPVSSPLPMSPPPLPASPTHPLGYRAAMIRLRAESPSTSHPLPLPLPIVLPHTRASMAMMRAAAPSTYILASRSETPPSGTPPLLPIPLPTSSPPLLLPSTDCRADVPEVTLPPQKRLCIAPGPRYEVGECSSAPTARPTGGFRADYGFVGTMDAEIRRDPDREIGYGITDILEDPDEIAEEIPATDVAELGQRMTNFVMTVRQDTDEIYGTLDDAHDDRSLMSGQLNLLQEKARRRGRVLNWQTATYGKIVVDDDLHDLSSVEAKFPAIVINDAFAPQDTLQCKSQVSTPVNDEIDFRISFDESDDEDYTIIYDKNSFSYKMISVNNLKTDSENDIEKVIPFHQPPEPTTSCFDDLDFFKDFENEFPAIVYNDAQTYEGLQYTKADIKDFETRLTRIYRREVQRVHVFDFGGLLDLMAEGLSARMLMEHQDAQGVSLFGQAILDLDTPGALQFQLGGARRRMSWREFILALGLYTAEEMQTAGFGAYWADTSSYTMIQDPILRLCHSLIACSIAGRSQAPEKVTVMDLFYLRGMDIGSVNFPYLLARYLRLFVAGRKSGAHISGGQFMARLAEHFGLLTKEILGGLTVIAPKLLIVDMTELVRLHIYVQLDDTWAWVDMGPERQPDAAAGAPAVAEDASAIDEADQAVLGLVQAPQQPPPPPPAATRTMP
ncbi:hypothetical protein Tco_1029541 [Tanacetum coccineum]|uniref:Uncharacterized protein n=1 Tax=Tanacetum coccineum TaxID=301880 RepID=A0ABQ5G419_9ASTR